MTHSQAEERLYHLLPAIYRIRDEAQNGQLRVFLSIIERELQLIETDIDQLYDNWFVETCEDWVVPYIGDLLAVNDLNAASPRTYGQERRAYVANTLTYRQRKGTTPVLEQLARDITGWGARTVEALPQLATTQHLNHPRLQSTTVDLRRDRQPENLGTPFEGRAAYTTALQRTTGRSLYNPASIALFLWRLQSYPLSQGTARAIPGPDPKEKGRYFTFNALGYDAPLSNQPQAETQTTTLAQEINLPGTLTRSLLAKELVQRRQDLLQKKLPMRDGYFGETPVLQIWEVCNGQKHPIKPEEILIHDLKWEDNAQWQPPQSETFYYASDYPPTPPQNSGACPKDAQAPAQIAAKTKVAVDPETGRLAFLAAVPDRVEVSYTYGFSGDVGGGVYEHPELTPQALSGAKTLADIPPAFQWLRTIAANNPDPNGHSPLRAAIRTWNCLAQSLQQCYDTIYIPLVRLAVGSNGKVRQLEPMDPNDPMTVPPRFQAGVVAGLTVLARIGDRDAAVMPGMAVDDQGQPIVLQFRYRVSLNRYRNQWITLAIALSQPEQLDILLKTRDPRGKIQILSEKPQLDCDSDQLAAQASPSYPLVRLRIDQMGQIAQIETNVWTPFSPGIVEPLSTPVAISNGAIKVSKLVAVNRQGQRIYWENDQDNTAISFLPFGNQVVLLYLAPTDAETQSGKLGVVQDAKMGCIQLQGNQTYRGNFTIQVPSGRGFQIIAANGDRPHLRGHIAIRGMATSDIDPGECYLQGLLLEGKLTVLPGSLERLAIAHCTLVPQAGGLEVEKTLPPLPDEDTDSLTLIALIVYVLTLIQHLVKLSFGDLALSPQQRLSRLLKLASHELSALFDTLLGGIQQCTLPESGGDEDDPDEDDEADGETHVEGANENNAQLTITLDHSIVGPIVLADTVPQLTIVDSIIDAGSHKAGRGAITAIGTQVDLQTTTVFGTTTVCSLEASNSLFTGKVSTVRRQIGCLRFCYVPAGSRTPQRYNCQPDLILAERVKPLPVAITALSVNPSTQQLFVGTAGQGVFQFVPSEHCWLAFNVGLSNLNITALLADSRPGTGTIAIRGEGDLVEGAGTAFKKELQPGDAITAAGETRNVLTIAADGQQLTLDIPFSQGVSEGLSAGIPFLIHTLLAGTVGGALFQLKPLIKPGLGTLSQIGGDRALAIGCGTKFREELAIGDQIHAANQSRLVKTIISDTELEFDTAFEPDVVGAAFLIKRANVDVMQPGSGSLSSTRDRTTIIGCGTEFQKDVCVGDTLTVEGQTCTVMDVMSDAALRVSPTLKQEIRSKPFRLIRHQWQPVTTAVTQQSGSNQSLAINTDITTLVSSPQPESNPSGTVLAGTAGNGILRSVDRGHQWTASNEGLTNLDVRAIVFDPHTGHLFAGTNGSGIFRSIDHGMTWAESDRESPENPSPLSTLHITALAINPSNGDLFAGTAKDGMFRSAAYGNSWLSINQGLSHLNITALETDTQMGQGSITSEETQVTGRDSTFTKELLEGDSIIVKGQTRTITAIASDISLTINRPFDPELIEPASFTITQVFAGTTAGTIFRSTSDGNHWELTNPSFSDTDITALKAWLKPNAAHESPLSIPTLLAGTQLGSLFLAEVLTKIQRPTASARLSEPGVSGERFRQQWRSLNSGLGQIDEALVILSQMRPAFASEDYGQPGYAQLKTTCPTEIFAGAEDGSEMGVFNYLKQPQREANLRASLKEYLRYGVQAEINYIT